MERQLQVYGTCTGTLWMPCSPGAKPFNRMIRVERGQSIGEVLEDALLRESGDFRDVARLTADSVIEVRHVYRSGSRTVRRERSFSAVDVPSLAEYVAPEHFSSDFFGEDY